MLAASSEISGKIRQLNAVDESITDEFTTEDISQSQNTDEQVVRLQIVII